ncbi:MAG: MurR/RpiR family transcriptional regulator [Lachnospiraceae bacterium]|nr:MurR/RpiR family transcriptional regulator [Lachnospiraceae bacterium]
MDKYENYEKSIVPIIEAKYNSFTNVEKNIANFFLKNQKKMDFSARTVSQEIFVSEASLSRFAKKCGFHGYREFVYQYEEGFVERSEYVANETKLVLDTYQELLNKTYSLMDEAKIARVVNYIYDSDRVVACGKGSSGLAASEMENRFTRIGVDIDSLTDSDRMRMQTVFQNNKSLVCGISISGETQEVLYLLRESYKRGAKTILFTANDKAEFAEYCTEVVLVASRKHLNLGNVISPQYPILVMLDIIYINYVNSQRYTKRGVYDDTLRALQAKESHIFS